MRSPLFALAIVALLGAALAGCTRAPAGTDDDGDGPPEAVSPTLLEAYEAAATALADEYPDARLTRMHAAVDAHGTVLAPVSLLFHTGGPAEYPDAWRSSYADAGTFVAMRVDHETWEADVSPVAYPLPTLQGVHRDVGAPDVDANVLVHSVREVLEPGEDGVYHIVLEPRACPDGSTTSWVVNNGIQAPREAVRVDAASGAVCEGPFNPDKRDDVFALAHVPSEHQRVAPGGTITVPVSVDVADALPEATELRLVATYENEEVEGPPAWPGTLPDGWSARVDPEAVTVDAAGVYHFNVTFTVGDEEGRHRVVVQPASNAAKFASGSDQPVRFIVRSG